MKMEPEESVKMEPDGYGRVAYQHKFVARVCPGHMCPNLYVFVHVCVCVCVCLSGKHSLRNLATIAGYDQ